MITLTKWYKLEKNNIKEPWPSKLKSLKRNGRIVEILQMKIRMKKLIFNIKRIYEEKTDHPLLKVELG
tara:strand:- start:262 stop:465 length:204 start_codon:yes stop_codon:yes gene_type:complete